MLTLNLKSSAAILSLGGLVFTVTHVQYWKWIFGIDSAYILSVTWYSMLLTIVLVCILWSVCKFGLRLREWWLINLLAPTRRFLAYCDAHRFCLYFFYYFHDCFSHSRRLPTGCYATKRCRDSSFVPSAHACMARCVSVGLDRITENRKSFTSVTDHTS